MRHPAFRRGFTEYRAGLPPDFDTIDEEALQYEIGRQFAVVCPRNVSLLLVQRKAQFRGERTLHVLLKERAMVKDNNAKRLAQRVLTIKEIERGTVSSAADIGLRIDRG